MGSIPVGVTKKIRASKGALYFFAIQQDCRSKVRSTSVGRQTPRKLRLPSPYQGAETRRGHHSYTLPKSKSLDRTGVCFDF